MSFGNGCCPAIEVTSVISLLNRLMHLEIKQNYKTRNGVPPQVTKLHAATTWAIILGFGKGYDPIEEETRDAYNSRLMEEALHRLQEREEDQRAQEVLALVQDLLG
eukprot:jgi/Botrbrau1/686/Bobra.160_2s0009.1